MRLSLNIEIGDPFMRAAVIVLAAVLLQTPMPGLASAQPGREFAAARAHTLAGVVLDPTGAAVADADLTLTDATGRLWNERTTSDGRFVLTRTGVPPYALTVVVPGFAPVVRTDIAPDSTPIVLTLEPATVEAHVEVTAHAATSASGVTRTSTPLLDIPQAVSVVTADVLREQAVSSMADALRQVPGVSQNLGEGRRDQFVIRGFSAQHDTLLDGTRDDAPYYRDVATVERIEVVKGPAAALFGRGSSGGLINRVLKAPRTDRAISDVDVTFGALGTRRMSADVGRPLGRTLSFRAAAAGEQSTTFRDDVSVRRATVAPSLQWTGVSTTALVQLEMLGDRRVPDRGIPSVNGRPADVRIGQGYGYAPDDYIDSNVATGSVRLEHRTARGYLLRQVARLGTYGSSYSNTAATGTTRAATGAWMVTRQQYNAEQTQRNLFSQSEVVIATRTGAVSHVWLAGVEAGQQTRSLVRFNGTAAPVALANPMPTRPVYSATAALYNRFDGTTLGAYAQDQLTLHRRWKALLGVRVDRYTQTLDDRRPDDVDLARVDRSLSPRAGLVYQPVRALSVYSSVSQSYQPSGEGLSLAANAADLKPERSRNLEGGVKADLGHGRASATVSVFRLDRTNIKTTDPVDPTRLVLVGAQRTDGVELSVEGSPLPRLRVQGGYAWLDAVVLRSNTVTSGVRVEGNRPGLVPQHAGSIWAHYAVSPRLSVSGGFTANAQRFTSNDNLVTLPAYRRVDAGMSYRAGRIELALNARNLLDARYVDTASSNAQIMPGAPRDVLVTLRVAR